jgi:hypothetical protein
MLRPFQSSKIQLMFNTIRQCGNLSTKNVYPHKGLLSGINDINNADFYSDNIALKDSNELLMDTDRIYNICFNNAGKDEKEMDATLKTIIEKINVFIKSDEVWNRNEFIESIQTVIGKSGMFCCVLGGKNTGKSLVLSEIEKQYPNKVFKVNLREQLDILTGLVCTLRDRQNLNASDTIKVLLTNIVSTCLEKYMNEDDMQKILNISTKNQATYTSLSYLINELANNIGNVTLVIDEANLAFSINDKTTLDEFQSAKKVLALFTSLTKERNKVIIFL